MCLLSGITVEDVSLKGGTTQIVTILDDKCWHRNPEGFPKIEKDREAPEAPNTNLITYVLYRVHQ